MQDIRVLNKSLPYKDIIMVFKSSDIALLEQPQLPLGFSLKPYSKKDERQWAKIEYSVDEFDSVRAARKYFKQQYMHSPEKLAQGLIFACNEKGTPVASCTLWHSESHPAMPMIHWVATLPQYQNMGLARAVVTQCLKNAGTLHPGKDIFLHTQTWSHKAITLYHKIGFLLVKNAVLNEWNNDYDEAMAILKDVYPPLVYRELEEKADTCKSP